VSDWLSSSYPLVAFWRKGAMDGPPEKYTEILTYGASTRKLLERQEELAHERQLALIRMQSHALTWTGTSADLIATITRWYECGWLMSASLADALDKAAYHFLRPDGTAVIAPPSVDLPVEAKPITSRAAFVTSILESKGWSILDWANESGVSPATAHDYLANKTNPYRSTRLKLAKSLGISIQELPR
jgi:lambda repressor-like predicted transcriptional regulator